MTFKSKNMKPLYIIFVTTLTLLGAVSCKTKKYTNYQIEGKKLKSHQNTLQMKLLNLIFHLTERI